jgi:hypothetical protein
MSQRARGPRWGRKNGVGAYRDLEFSHSGVITALERTARLDYPLACMQLD